MVSSDELITADDVVDHFEHVSDLVGVEHVSMGSDMGSESTTRRKFSEAHIRLTLGWRRG